MNTKNIFTPLAGTLLLAATLTACVSSAGQQDGLAAKAKIIRPAAEFIALDRVPNGMTVKTTIAREKGALVWSVQIVETNKKFLVKVDANTGAILSTTQVSK